MKAIYKHEVPIHGEVFIDVPAGARPLCVNVQNGEPQVWVEVDPKETGVGRIRVVSAFTGEEFEEGMAYLGTCLLHGGKYVIHIYYSDIV